MNIFYLSRCPILSAQQMVDRHIVKMPLESAQMLCTAHRILDDVSVVAGVPIYKATHKNHPSAVWVRQSTENYSWLYRHFMALCDEYTLRYGKTHLCDTKFHLALSHLPKNLPYGDFTEPPACMPDNCKIDGDTIASYRKYYITEKRHIAYWKTNIPLWYK